MLEIVVVVAVGFLAQILGGSLGMGYGVSASTGLSLIGFSPAASSSVIHVVEIGTSLFNGTLHWRAKNVDWRVVMLIGIPGALTAFTGAILLSLFNLNATKPYVAGVLLVLGVQILWRFVRGTRVQDSRRAHPSWLIPLGAVAGFIDSSAGGGWGVMTTSTLVVTKTMDPAKSAGTTSTARLLVALLGTLGFLIGLGFGGINWLAIVGMLIGGLIALPVIGLVIKYVAQTVLGITMGLVLIALNSRQLCITAGLTTSMVVTVMLIAPLVFLALTFAVTKLLRR